MATRRRRWSSAGPVRGRDGPGRLRAGVAASSGHQKVLDAMVSGLMRVCRMYWAKACMID